MNQTNLEHALFGLLIMALGWALLALIGVVGAHWAGAALAIGFFIGREYTQNEHELAKARGVTISSLRWYDGLDVRTWSLDSKLDLLAPVIACLTAAYFLPLLAPPFACMALIVICLLASLVLKLLLL